MMQFATRFILWFSIFTLIGIETSLVSAASPSIRKELDEGSYNLWKTIDSAVLTNDGRWIIYTVSSAVGDAAVVARSTKGDLGWKVSRGRVPAHLPSLGTRPLSREEPQLTSDSRFVIFYIAPAREPVQGNEPVALELVASEATLAILRLSDGQLISISNVSSLALPKSEARYLAYTVREHATDTATAISDRSATIVADKYSLRHQAPTSHDTLVLHDLKKNVQVRIPSVSDYTFDNNGRYLAYATSERAHKENGVYLRSLQNGRVAPILVGSGDHSSLSFDRAGTRLAFLSSQDESGNATGSYSIYLAAPPAGRAQRIVSNALHAGMRVYSSFGVQFSQDGGALMYRLSPMTRGTPIQSSSGARKDEADEAEFDLWHWRHADIQTHQRAVIPSYLAVYHLDKGRVVQLEDKDLPAVLLTSSARHGVGIDQNPYKREATWGNDATWDRDIADVYVIDAISGKRNILRRGFRTSEGFPFYPFKLSPNGKYLLFFEDRRWFSYDFERSKLVDLTGTLLRSVQFHLNHPDGNRRPRIPIGIGGWTEGDERVLVYGRHDVWEIDPAGEHAARSLTDQVGQRRNIRFRIWPDKEYNPGLGVRVNEPIDASRPLLLTAHDLGTMRSGVWTDQFGAHRPPRPLLMLDKEIALIARAAEARQLLVSKQTFSEFPDLWTGEQLTALRKVSDVNPQQKAYKWGDATLVSWTNDFGARLKGVLYKPEDFDPKKKYPMIVHIYGVFSPWLHLYTVPRPESSANILWSLPMFVSQGYLVFRPDIRQAAPFPGHTALASVISGVRTIKELGFVDASRIGLVGFSTGGYETNFIVTQTNEFRCAVTGGGMSDSVSDYGVTHGGILRSYYYERGAALHGGSIWENPFVYFVNSPVLFADRVNTPVLMMHNEDDAAVPFAQGIEFYIALRRNKKEVYMFNYKGEGHGLHRYPNRVHWDRRMREFLDHFLKDKPEPAWMEYGIPATIVESPQAMYNR